MKTLARDEYKAELLRRLHSVRPDATPRWGRMSAHQMICHLGDSFRMATGQKAVAHVKMRLPAPLTKWIALYVPLRWPTEVPTTPELDQLCDGTKPVNFASDLADVESLLETLADKPAYSVWPSHPIFGRMSQRDWFRWAYLHTDHHLRQFRA